ncbi:fungal hydrophobin domain-containing protein [Pochonia chlamydosporia 170]|uniref:Fungal hydrophobin domain-containing protein n=1 Tax=Pochonia chlamydosporia 170 TaxID=1380566 RepID=A0A179F7W7_METCM|nr:fungal hydrophobin domain-containing protein [Pochonia chlamydosporia 170]OAQ61575.1 fungal hydrophobin domain-containing protein [Pochonia chlamydosporia 170]
MKTIFTISVGLLGTCAASSVCPPSLLSGNAVCCSTNVLGALGLDCTPPNRTPIDGPDLASICSEDGKEATCCGVPIVGQGVVCSPALGA